MYEDIQFYPLSEFLGEECFQQKAASFNNSIIYTRLRHWTLLVLGSGTQHDSS